MFGGELSKLDEHEFKDLDKLDIVGIYPNYATAYAAWKAKAQQTVDNAQMRYFIVHLHRLLDPEAPTPAERAESRITAMRVLPKRIATRALGSEGDRRRRGANYLRLVWTDQRGSSSSRRTSTSASSRICRSSWRCGTASIS